MLRVNISIAVLILVTTLVCLFASDASENRPYEIREGDHLLVLCNVTDGPDIKVFWTKNDTKHAFMQQGKRLEILNINRSYSGDYICHALNTSFPVSDYNETDVNRTIEVINVDVQFPAEVDYFGFEPYDLIENDTFEVTCEMRANPQPIWTIRNRETGREILSATQGGRITTGPSIVTCEDTGYWECTGYNLLNNGANVSKGHTLSVYCPPRPQIQQNQYLIQTTLGIHTEMKMYIQANPKATCTWSKDDGMNISDIVIQEDFANETTLSIPMMSVPYLGNYTLKMQNQLGTYIAHYQIAANGPPETPSNLQCSNITYDTAELQWTSGFDMGSKQHFIVMNLVGDHFIQISNLIYDNSKNHGIDQNWTCILTGLVSGTHYNLTVVSENERGFMSPLASPSIVFMTKKYPHTDKASSKTDVTLILGLTFGTIGAVVMLAFIVYVLKNRKLRTPYVSMDESTAFSMNDKTGKI